MFDKADLLAAVRDQLRPVLRKAGFSRFNGRNAWRITPKAIDIVSVQLGREEVDEDYNIRPSRTFSVLMACCQRSAWPSHKSKRTGEMVPTKLPHDYNCSNRYRYGLDAVRHQPTWEVAVDGSNLPR